LAGSLLRTGLAIRLGGSLLNTTSLGIYGLRASAPQ
jgi:hypothetical protein